MIVGFVGVIDYDQFVEEVERFENNRKIVSRSFPGSLIDCLVWKVVGPIRNISEWNMYMVDEVVGLARRKVVLWGEMNEYKTGMTYPDDLREHIYDTCARKDISQNQALSELAEEIMDCFPPLDK